MLLLIRIISRKGGGWDVSRGQCGGREGGVCEGVSSRSYAVSAPANRVASQQYCYIMRGTDIALYPGRGVGHKGWGAAAHYVHGVLINGELA